MEEKIHAISILRIIATFMVVMVHFGQSLPLPSILHEFVAYGATGVTIFFVISGYVIAMSLDWQEDVGIFYKKRIVRIVPIYFAVIIVNAIAAVMLGTYPVDVVHLKWVRYFLFFQAILPSNSYFYWNNAASLWTMSAFAIFYFIAPVIHRYVKRKNGEVSNKKSFRILVGGGFLSLISESVYRSLPGEVFTKSNSYLAAHSPFTVLFEFFTGMFIYYVFIKNREVNKNWLIPIWGIGVFGSIFGQSRFIITALYGWLVYCIAEKEIKCNAFVEKVLKKLDEYSFAIYLGHTTIMFIMSRIQEAVGFSNMKLAILDLVGCITFIPILHEFIEKPGTKLAKKILKI